MRQYRKTSRLYQVLALPVDLYGPYSPWIVAELDERFKWSQPDSPVLIIGGLVIVALEDRTRQAELPGYWEYAQCTRCRLLSGVYSFFERSSMSTVIQVQHGMSPQVRRGVTRWIIRESMGVVMLALLLFLAAGTADWTAGWAMVIVMAGWVIATAIVVIPRYPELLAERMGPKKGAKTWDTALLGLYGVAMMIMWIVAGLDLRYSWSSGIGPVAQIGAMLIVIAGYGLVVWATGVNAFFSQVVRIQTERRHTVVSSGPYRHVRHPAYVGMILVLLGAPIMLGSWWALIPGGVSAILMIVRTALEDKTLLNELDGYKEYAARVRHRLLPGVW